MWTKRNAACAGGRTPRTPPGAGALPYSIYIFIFFIECISFRRAAMSCDFFCLQHHIMSRSTSTYVLQSTVHANFEKTKRQTIFFLLQTLSSSLTGLWGPIWNALATFDCKLKTVRGKSFAAHSATRINLDNARKCGVSEARRGAHKIIISLKPTRKPCENNAKNDETLPSLCERTRRFLGGVFPEALILSQRAEIKCRNQLKTRRFRKNARKSIK